MRAGSSCRWAATVPAMLAAIVLLLCAVPGHACSVCSAPNSPSPGAFTLSTVFLSLLPLLMVGGTIYWIRCAWRQREALLQTLPYGADVAA